MGKISAILQAAQQRAKELNLPYEGALYPNEAFEIQQSAPGTRLVDVRSRAEQDWVGIIPGAKVIEWSSYPGMIINPNFIAQLEQQVDKEALVIFFCRSGVRSHHATTATICWKVSKATRTPASIAIPSAAGAPQACPGNKVNLDNLKSAVHDLKIAVPCRCSPFALSPQYPELRSGNRCASQHPWPTPDLD